MNSWDCIVLGVGGVGSSALFHLASRGLRVVGIDRFPPGHNRGSSHGQTRLIRMAYAEHPGYVPLVRRAYALWEELSQRTGQTLYHETGVLHVGLNDGEIVGGALASARLHGLSVETLAGRDAERRFPGFRVPEPYVAVLEPVAGYLEVENCVQAHAAEAQKAGAQLQIGESVLDWSASTSGVTVRTDKQTYVADKLVINPGAWAPSLLSSLGVPLEVVRKPLYWYETDSPDYRADRGCPGFLFEIATGIFYGFPQIDDLGLKVAEHSGGHVVADPLQVDRSEDPAETERLSQFLSEFTPKVSRRLTRFEVCLYTLSPDLHFIIDHHPEHPNVVFAAGLSGHGFKFTSALGELLADLAVKGRSDLDWQFLRCNRPGLR
jgi:sarcosine oxidase